MAKCDVNPRKIVVFTGAGISIDSGIPAFRFGEDALWCNHNVNEVATKAALNKSPEKVIDFFNERKKEILAVEPNVAHYAIAKLEEQYEVVVITTNIDDLHERAGSTNVIHVHGSILNARSSEDHELVYSLGDKFIQVGDKCEKGSQLRPDIVLFDEEVHLKTSAQQELKDASKVMIIGSSLSVKPICNIFRAARGRAEKLIVTPERIRPPYGFKHYPEKSSRVVPLICEKWLRNGVNN